MGVGIAFWAGIAGSIPKGIGHDWMGALADGVSLAMIALLGYSLVRAARRRLNR